MRFNFYALFLITFFSYLPTVYAQAPCGTVDHPETKAYWQAHDLAYSKWLRANPQWNSRLPERMFIQPHIVTRTDGTGGVSLVDFYDAINFTTLQYLKANIAIQVCDINYIANDQAYDYVLPTSEDFLLGFNVPNRINIYFVSNPRTVSSDQGYVCGYTYRPGGPKIIIMANNCTANGTTLAHEIGHYMSLYHTHGTTNNGTTNELVDGSNCGTAGDRICDTPADPNLSGQVDANCVYTGSDRDANGMLFQPDPSNIMAYSPDRCQDYFSEGQLSLMAFTLQGVRDELLADAPCGGDFGDCLTVTTTDDYGYGSLRIAIGCANQNPGPDTIRFRFPAGASPTILLNEALPTLTDDGTVIDASLPNSGPEARVNLSGRNMLAEGDGMLNIEGQKIEVLNLGFKEYRIGASGGSTEVCRRIPNLDRSDF
ncbi:MAG: M43 family zinc metalloprotease, partial [Bacteroidota bacterium]